MPGGMYFVVGVTWSGTFVGNRELYMAVLATTAHDGHWWALGMQ
jgi:hypothetical protein